MDDFFDRFYKEYLTNIGDYIPTLCSLAEGYMRSSAGISIKDIENTIIPTLKKIISIDNYISMEPLYPHEVHLRGELRTEMYFDQPLNFCKVSLLFKWCSRRIGYVIDGCILQFDLKSNTEEDRFFKVRLPMPGSRFYVPTDYIK
jgi:hypothetical protein